MKEVAVVIPIYSEISSRQETIALLQAIDIFERYDIIAAAPNYININEHIFKKVERFEDSFFRSIDSYNKLMLSKLFYERFQDYEYILIYQLDAFVFSDLLSYFCKLNYDYIGAPWLYGQFRYVDASHCVWNVGNGGFSLRKVHSFITVLSERKPLECEYTGNEDIFFSSIVDEKFIVAPIEIALQFSFERQVKECYSRNYNKLPFGCHAWGRYDYGFWKPFIEKFGYDLQESNSLGGNDDEKRRDEYSFWKRFSIFFTDGRNVDRARYKLKRLLEVEDKEYAIWGAGFYGYELSKWFVDMEIPIKCFYDSNIKLIKEMRNGYPVVSTTHLQQHDKRQFIIVSSYEYSEVISKQLVAMNYKEGKDFLTLNNLLSWLQQ